MKVAGFGFRTGASLASFQAAYAMIGPADALATAEDKAAGLAPFAAHQGLPVIHVTRAALATHRRPGSARVTALYSTGSLAESAALAAAGPGARLMMPRVTSPDGQVVAALAESPT